MATKKKSENGEGRKPASPSIPAVDFVKAWQAAGSLEEARKVLGDGASSRAARMRKAGVKLKEFAGGGRKLNVAALNALISGAQ